MSKLAEPTTPVRRDGHRTEIRAEYVVPGDVILVEAGRRVAADARLIEGFGLAADESALTGESVPVDVKADRVFPETTPVAERFNMACGGKQRLGPVSKRAILCYASCWWRQHRRPYVVIRTGNVAIETWPCVGKGTLRK